MMGAGGEREWHWDEYKKSDIKKIKKDQERKSFYPELNELLSKKLSNFNSRDTEQINQHLDTILKALESEIEGPLKLIFGGSIKKYTYVNGLSDVDMLVVLNNSELANKNPKEVMDYFKVKIEQRLPNSEISVGNLAISVKFKSTDIEIQLLPAIKTKTGLKISDLGLNKWSNVIKPDKFASRLTEINKQNIGRVVPVIKLFKSINEKLPNDIKMSGYHIEALAIKAFENYKGETKYSEMLRSICKQAKSLVLHPIEETTGQTDLIDSKFGPRNSELRIKLSNHLNRIVNKMDLATASQSKKSWEALLE